MTDRSAQAVKALQLKDGDDNPMEVVSHRVLEPERKARFAETFPQCNEANNVYAIVARPGGGGDLVEYLGVLKEEGEPAFEIVNGECQITYEDLPLGSIIEYSFSESPDKFALALVARDALETYRGTKFKTWKDMLDNPTCEAQFRRMLQIGVITALFDDHLFPTPDDQKPSYQVTDEKTGKTINLPHPVWKLRQWNPASLQYDSIDPHLDGAPTEAERATYWEQTLADFKSSRGEEYINGLLGQ